MRIFECSAYTSGTIILSVSGILSIITGYLINILDPYNLILNWKLIFAAGGEIFEIWQAPPIDLFATITIFNITNANEFLSGKTNQIQVEEVGPYVYREVFTHENVTFNDNSTLSFDLSHRLQFEPELSNGRSEDDLMMLPNVAMLSLAQLGAESSYFTRFGVNMLIRNLNAQPIVQQTAKEIMFGYETALVTLGHTFMPSWIDFDKIGVIDRFYDFSDTFGTADSGEKDPRNSGVFSSYMGSSNLSQWNDEHCNNIVNASDGVKFKSFFQSNESLTFFRKSICRPLPLVPTEELTMHGISATKFEIEKNALDNGEIDERNKCFCKNGNCLPKGFIDISSCYYGFPLAITNPHFLGVDPKLVEHIHGLHPENSKHNSYFYINRDCGFPLEFSIKLQANLIMKDVKSMANCDKVSNMVLPIMWADIGMKELPKLLRIKLLFYVTIIPAVIGLIFYSLIISGIILLLISIKRLVRKPKDLKPEDKFAPNRRKSLGYYEASVDTLMSVTTSLTGDFGDGDDKELQEFNFRDLNANYEDKETDRNIIFAR